MTFQITIIFLNKIYENTQVLVHYQQDIIFLHKDVNNNYRNPLLFSDVHLLYFIMPPALTIILHMGENFKMFALFLFPASLQWLYTNQNYLIFNFYPTFCSYHHFSKSNDCTHSLLCVHICKNKHMDTNSWECLGLPPTLIFYLFIYLFIYFFFFSFFTWSNMMKPRSCKVVCFPYLLFLNMYV